VTTDSAPAAPDLPSSPEEIFLRGAARAAEDAGDFPGARRLAARLRAGPERERWLASLDEVLSLGPDPEPDLLARWLLQPALRFGLRPDVAPAYLRFADEVLRAWGYGARARTELARYRALSDPLVADAGLFDGGGLARYLTDGVCEQVRCAAAPIETWSRQPASVFAVTASGSTALHLQDLASGAAVVTLPMPGPEPGQLVYGRLLPDARGRRMFAFPPVPVDRLTAGRVRRAVLRSAPATERIRAVAVYQRRSSSGD
jgi:hypothetical protein